MPFFSNFIALLGVDKEVLVLVSLATISFCVTASISEEQVISNAIDPIEKTQIKGFIINKSY